MPDDKKQVKNIPPKGEDLSEWYTQVCLKAQLVDYAPVRGCIVLRPYGFAVWDLIRGANSFIEDRAPWALNKAGETKAVAAVIGDCLETLRIVALLASPVIPNASAELWRRLGLPGRPEDQRVPAAAQWGLLPAGSKLIFQIHYTPNGTTTKDQVRFGVLFAKSAPENPGVPLAMFRRFTFGPNRLSRAWTFNTASRPSMSGASTTTCRSKRPGRKSARSSTSGRFVAASKIMPAFGWNPSISTSN